MYNVTVRHPCYLDLVNLLQQIPKHNDITLSDACRNITQNLQAL